MEIKYFPVGVLEIVDDLINPSIFLSRIILILGILGILTFEVSKLILVH